MEDKIFEIDRDGNLLRTIDIAELKNPSEDNTDAEGLTWMYGERFALVMEGGEEMAVFNIDASTVKVVRSQVSIFDLSGDPKGVAYKASEDALYWVSQTAPMRVVKSHLNTQNGRLETIWNKTVDNLPDAGLADIAFFPRLSPHLFLIGQSSNTIMEVDLNGPTAVIKSTFSIGAFPIPRPGGMAFDPDGSFRIVGKHAANVPQDDFSVFVPTGPIENSAPRANAGTNITAFAFDSIAGQAEVDGSFSGDDDGAIIDYQWFVNGDLVSTGYGPRVGALSHRFALGISTVTLIVRDDAYAVDQTSILVAVTPWTPGNQIPVTYPQPTGFPNASLNYVHPGALLQQAEFYFELKETGFGEIWIYDQSGRRVKAFRTPTFPPGQYRAPWDLMNDEGSHVSSGVYFVVIKTPSATKKEKLVVVR